MKNQNQIFLSSELTISNNKPLFCLLNGLSSLKIKLSRLQLLDFFKSLQFTIALTSVIPAFKCNTSSLNDLLPASTQNASQLPVHVN